MNLLAIVILAVTSQNSPPSPLAKALIGSWVGTLEYRDYSDNSRERLGTLLRVSKGGDDNHFIFRYVYDDGPHKVVQDEDQVEIDGTKASYVVSSSDGKETDHYSISGLKGLSNGGFGSLTLLGKATENGTQVDIRETLTLQPTTLRILRESKLPGKTFLFRHELVFQRVEAPKVK